jgi:hypothetical protein
MIDAQVMLESPSSRRGGYADRVRGVSKKEEHIASLLQAAGCQGPRGPYDAYFYYFNCQKFYEAHDVLEHLWLQERNGPDNNFFKALIQLAGAFVHLQKDRLKPAGALFRLSRSYLEPYPKQHQGLDLANVLAVIDHWLSSLATRGSNPLHQEPAPVLALHAKVPTGCEGRGPEGDGGYVKEP